MNRVWPADRAVERLIRCVIGLVIFGVGVAMLIDADLGPAPWDVFHTGVSELTGASVGVVMILTGVALLALWIPLRERIGIGTVLNAVLIGATVDVVLPLIPDDLPLVARGALVVGGVVVVAIGSGLYIGAGVGPGPRDGLMTGLGKRGIPLGVARTGIELTVMVIGVALGGTIGVGTAVFAFGIGPAVQVAMPRLSMDPSVSTDAAIAAAAEG